MTENINDIEGNITDDVSSGHEESPSVGVIRAVADAADVDPAELETPLYDRIDPDALDDLFDDRPNGIQRGSGYVVFSLLDYDVTVYSNGNVVVSE